MPPYACSAELRPRQLAAPPRAWPLGGCGFEDTISRIVFAHVAYAYAPPPPPSPPSNGCVRRRPASSSSVSCAHGHRSTHRPELARRPRCVSQPPPRVSTPRLCPPRVPSLPHLCHRPGTRAPAPSRIACSLSCSAAGYDAVETTEAGWTLEQLKGAGCTPKELRKAGHSATAMRVVGFEIEHLKRCAATSSAPPPLSPPRPHPGPGVSHHI